MGNALIQCPHAKGDDNDGGHYDVSVLSRQRGPGRNNEQSDPMHTCQRWMSMD